MTEITRRDFLFGAALAPALAGLQPPPGGRLLGTIPLGASGARRTPLNHLLGSGLDARLFTDLSTLAPQSDLVTPNERFYVRTAAPAFARTDPGELPPSRGRFGETSRRGRPSPPAGTEVRGIDFARLERSPGRTRVGPYLMECAGNSDPANFGLMSVASWAQVPGATRAGDFAPAVIDTAAMPIRVEKWRVSDRIEYRITGIIWGGSTPTNALSIRFRSGGPWLRVDRCPMPTSTLMWSLWTHTWRPEAPGRYEIVLRVDDPSIRTRRLDLFFYVREIEISEV